VSMAYYAPVHIFNVPVQYHHHGAAGTGSSALVYQMRGR
jgi:hypothetical protein